ncbi:hypothetical protein MFLO_07552 [Listeria floridensis FSL S10-1187]|uniref:Uncharacterized protein n=1 Tax=Listeria floridensis FSL S10-1187 TaxID=1265817 RepID=A0ABN0RFD2_9LIST|nr:hypothetical protein [Listeria floridensis]EUJ32027.1 hypothetical protein MFLO_07552 [Listeria floridensis FSL S10-1187]
MSEVDIRYYVIPMIVVFILGIATVNSVAFPVLDFLLVSLIAVICGVIVGSLYQLYKIVLQFVLEYKEKRSTKKRFRDTIS